ncbi:MAG: universal stress protein [Candidatus Dadabacteria bacterium]|nr:universal stress protein [Candidatus Dadabacteria bacterium]
MDESILIPTDFSEVAHRAAAYAIALGNQLNIRRLVLYHAWQQSNVVDINMPGMTLVNEDEIQAANDEWMGSFAETVQNTAGDGFEIITEIDYNPLDHGVAHAAEKHGAAYVVMSVTGSGKFAEKLIGSSAVSVARKINVPVIIVPGDYEYETIGRIALSCDYKDAEHTVPFGKIASIVEKTGARLFVVYVDTNGGLPPDTLEENNDRVKRLLRVPDAEFHHLKGEKYIDAVNGFSEESGIDLVIAVPKKKGFFELLFKGSHTAELAFRSVRPIMIIHDGE